MTEVLLPPQGPRDQIDTVNAEFLAVAGAEHLTYAGLFGRYAMSPFGLFHADQPVRYSNKYEYDRELMLADLGDNIHPIRHMQYTEAEIFRPLAAMQNDPVFGTDEKLTDIEIVAGRFGTLMHDIGECEHPDIADACGETIGDVNFWEKNADHDEQEKKIREFLYATYYADVPSEVMGLAETMIYSPKESFLGQSFAMTEQAGYFLADLAAGLRALELRDTIRDETDELRFAQLKRMSTSELPGWYEHLAEQSPRFPFVADLVERTTQSVAEVIDGLAA